MTDALTAAPAEPFTPGPAGAEIAPADPRLPSLVGLPVTQAQAVLRRLGMGCTLSSRAARQGVLEGVAIALGVGPAAVGCGDGMAGPPSPPTLPGPGVASGGPG